MPTCILLRIATYCKHKLFLYFWFEHNIRTFIRTKHSNIYPRKTFEHLSAQNIRTFIRTKHSNIYPHKTFEHLSAQNIRTFISTKHSNIYPHKTFEHLSAQSIRTFIRTKHSNIYPRKAFEHLSEQTFEQNFCRPPLIVSESELFLLGADAATWGNKFDHLLGLFPPTGDPSLTV
jgi:vacuolar-type H+-ATPase subunit C/Vma6